MQQLKEDKLPSTGENLYNCAWLTIMLELSSYILMFNIIIDHSGDDNDDTSGYSSPMPYASAKEKYLNGLLHGKRQSRRNVDIGFVDGRGRSGFARRDFRPDDFVCEYEARVRKKRDGTDWDEVTNEELGLGCYCLDVVYEQQQYTFDATSVHNAPGRYINHARRNPNLILKRPVMIGRPPKRRLRIGLVAKCHIKKGTELFFDYGIQDDDFPWLQCDAKKIGTTYDQGNQNLIYDSYTMLVTHV